MCSPQTGRIALGIGSLGLSEAVRPILPKNWQNNFDQAGALGLATPQIKSLFSAPSQQPTPQYQPQQYQPTPIEFTAFQPTQPFAPVAQTRIPGVQSDNSDVKLKTIK